MKTVFIIYSRWSCKHRHRRLPHSQLAKPALSIVLSMLRKNRLFYSPSREQGDGTTKFPVKFQICLVSLWPFFNLGETNDIAKLQDNLLCKAREKRYLTIEKYKTCLEFNCHHYPWWVPQSRYPQCQRGFLLMLYLCCCY